MAVSLRIPEDIKRRVEKLAQASDTTAHAFMVGAIEERLLAEETRAEYHAEATARLAHMKKTGRGIPAAEVFDYLRQRVQGETRRAAQGTQDRMILFSEAALADLEKIFEFNVDRDPAVALDHIDKIQSAVTVLEIHPEIGRRIAAGSPLRELVIAQGQAGYVALYEYSPVANRIRILAVRHQREAGHQDS